MARHNDLPSTSSTGNFEVQCPKGYCQIKKTEDNRIFKNVDEMLLDVRLDSDDDALDADTSSILDHVTKMVTNSNDPKVRKHMNAANTYGIHT